MCFAHLPVQVSSFWCRVGQICKGRKQDVRCGRVFPLVSGLQKLGCVYDHKWPLNFIYFCTSYHSKVIFLCCFSKFWQISRDCLFVSAFSDAGKRKLLGRGCFVVLGPEFPLGGTSYSLRRFG